MHLPDAARSAEGDNPFHTFRHISPFRKQIAGTALKQEAGIVSRVQRAGLPCAYEVLQCDIK
jgi:hypothetical protein